MDSCWIVGEFWWLVYCFLGCFGVNGIDGVGIMVWFVINEIRNLF